MAKFEGEEWTFPLLEAFWEEIEEIGREFGITYPTMQIEVVSATQMVDVIASVGAPCHFDHWSLGKEAIELEEQYKKGKAGVALELIINSDPSIMYLLENNTLIEQGVTLAHAGIGHGSVFKHNYLFKKWTDPTSILDYFSFSKKYMSELEKIQDPAEVEILIDACKALTHYSVSHHDRIRLKDKKLKLNNIREEYVHLETNVFTETYRKKLGARLKEEEDALEFPEENLLYFLEKHRINKDITPEITEILRIYRKIEEYFYPQRRTKILNEGWATFIEYKTFERLLEKGLITEGGFLEFLRTHTNIIGQSAYSSPHYSGSLNPYSIGFKIFNDLYRMTIDPTEEDLQEYPEICNTDWRVSLMDIVRHYSDETFIQRYLTHSIVKDMNLFSVNINRPDSEATVMGVDYDIKTIRKDLASSLDIFNYIPRFEIVNAIKEKLYVKVYCRDGMDLEEEDFHEFALYFAFLWGGTLYIETVGGQRYIYR